MSKSNYRGRCLERFGRPTLPQPPYPRMCSGWIPSESSATSMRRPAPVKRFSWSCHLYSQTADQREARLASSLSFLERLFVRPSDTADRRPAGGAQCCHPEFSNHRFALLPSALFVELLPRCQLGVLDWKRVLPSRSRTECLCFRRRSFLADAAVTRTRRFGLRACQAATFFCSCRAL